RNSQIINAMAMIPEAVKMWGRETAVSLKSQVEAQDRNIIFSGISKACRNHHAARQFAGERQMCAPAEQGDLGDHAA
ncbi:hypothetical protein, partial [Rhizobium leguminosarum]|uniref:hypothetical protein n=1 Tax=Rhizobium leguminosarum TaxID=384 RepID=UPI003F982EF3